MHRLALIATAVLLLSAPALAQDIAKKDAVPYRADAGLITAEYYLATGKYMQALEVLQDVLSRHDRNADGYAYRGYAQSRLGDDNKAEADYRLALAIDPTHLGAHKYIADLYIKRGELDRAREQMQAMRAICLAAECAELTELQHALNTYGYNKAPEKADE